LRRRTLLKVKSQLCPDAPILERIITVDSYKALASSRQCCNGVA
jgi:hypothetical protein